jgi:hypothetical protein
MLSRVTVHWTSSDIIKTFVMSPADALASAARNAGRKAWVGK